MTVPHDGLIGNDFSGVFKERTKGWKGRDLHVWPIVNDILVQTGRDGFSLAAVRLLMARAYVDGNRRMSGGKDEPRTAVEDVAFEDPRLRSIYEKYHRLIATYLERSIALHGEYRTLLLDFHGFGRQPCFAPTPGFDVILGTANRTTVPYREVDRELAWHLERKGYSVFLPEEKSTVPGGNPYSAGYTTRYYSARYKVNAVQIEMAPWFRTQEDTVRRKELAKDMSEFLVTYLAL
jgi:N-formylglutamate amidohydrolase